MTSQQVRWVAAGSTFAVLVVALAGLCGWLNVRGDPSEEEFRQATAPSSAEQISRGEYLARVGNCAGCHTVSGGAAYAGAVGIPTPFGTVFTSNLTPDDGTGIGSWSATDFWRAMHNGRSKDGRLLYPVFPYVNYSQISRVDSDAIYSFLRTQPKISQANKPHALRVPYDRQAALAVWRALYFRPVTFESETSKTPEWNRGAYIVRGLGHCIACHSSRGALGASRGGLELSGGLIPMQKWYAPSLASEDEASVAKWSLEDITSLLATGTTPRGSVLGPMADVVFQSTQHFTADDRRAVAVFLKDLPQSPAVGRTINRPEGASMSRGATLYKDRCASCHGETGKGFAGAYPALDENRAVTMESTVNIVRAVADGGFPPTTAGNARPYGMPPFRQSMSNSEIADVLTFVRNSWKNRAGPVSEVDVLQSR